MRWCTVPQRRARVAFEARLADHLEPEPDQRCDEARALNIDDEPDLVESTSRAAPISGWFQPSSIMCLAGSMPLATSMATRSTQIGLGLTLEKPK